MPVRNIRWLSGCPHPRHQVEPVATRLRELFAEPLVQVGEEGNRRRRRAAEFYYLPAEHTIRLRTTNAIESIFATARLRTEATRGTARAAAALAMGFKLEESTRARWRMSACA